jgi:hypothetical protein
VKKSHVTKAKKARQVESNVKSMTITCFDVKGSVHKEFVATGQTVNSGFYCDVLRRCVKSSEDVTPTCGRNRSGCFTMTTPRLTFPSSTSSFWQENNMAVISHTTYSPDLATCDFFLFPKIKLKLKRHLFDITE